MLSIEPTLDDDGVMDFVASGLVVLEGVIEESFNRRCRDLARGNCDALIASDDFTREVLLHPRVAGAARSLLGEDFLVPRGGHHHYFKDPHLGQTWHSDGLSGSGYDVVELQCYYYPHSVALDGRADHGSSRLALPRRRPRGHRPLRRHPRAGLADRAGRYRGDDPLRHLAQGGPQDQRPRPQHDQVFLPPARPRQSGTGSAIRRRFPSTATARASLT